MKKKVGGKQLWLRNEWFEKDRVCITQPISFLKANGTLVQKKFQQVPKERNLWPQKS